MFRLIESRKQSIAKKGGNAMDLNSRRGFGINEIIGIAAGLIIAALIVIPGLRTFAQSVMSALSTWWTDVSSTLFR